MKTTTIGRWAFTMSFLGVTLLGGGSAGAATAGHKSESGGPQAGHETSKAAPRSQDKPDSQPDTGAGLAAQPNPTPSNNKTQIVEDRLRRGELDEASAQGQISDRLDQFYQGSERLPGRQPAGPPDR
jgi:hypothetical protein